MIDPFGPIVGCEAARGLTRLLKEEAALASAIRMREYWRQNGVADREEGALFQRLQAMLEDGQLPPRSVREWNCAIAEYERERDAAANRLNDREAEICTRCTITPAFYCVAKYLILREAMARGGLARAAAVRYAPDRAEAMGAIYDYMRQVGWIDGPPERGI
jgi:hypothetical protein